MSTKHTPGPRGLVETLRDLQDNVHGEAVVPNAELATMERQAADLLAALERLETQFKARCGYPGDKDAILAARAAIARAKGESHG